jgi:hypothetical protein
METLTTSSSPYKGLSILRNVSEASVNREPFTYAVIEDALDRDLYATLVREFPDDKLLADGPLPKGKKVGKNACDLLALDHLSGTWKQFIEYHTSKEFYLEILSLFASDIRRLHPILTKDKNKTLESFGTAMRNKKNRRSAHASDDIVLDCQIMVDETTELRRPRGPHVDAVNEIFACLLYIPHPDDPGNIGGDLCLMQATDKSTIHSRKNTITVSKPPAELSDECVDTVRVIPYKANTAIFFINSPNSIHGVTERQATPIPRRHVNVIGETYSLRGNQGLFQIHRPAAEAQHNQTGFLNSIKNLLKF